jgi:Fe-S cluster biogenesis protein NfuA
MVAPREEILRVLREVLVPLLEADGAVVYMVETTDGTLRLHLAGRYAGCPGNTLAVRRFVEPALLAISPSSRVVVTSGALVPEGAERLSA